MWLTSFNRFQTYIRSSLSQASFIGVHSRLLSDISEQVTPEDAALQTVRVKISIPFWAKRFVAENFRRPQSEFAKVFVSGYGETFPGLPFESVVLIEGDKTSVLNTVNLISNRLRSWNLDNLPLNEKSRKSAEVRQKCMSLIVPHSISQQIIGQNGDNLSKLKEEYALEKCLVSPRTGLHNFGHKSFTERAVYLGGDSSAGVDSVVGSLINLVLSTPEHKLDDNLLYKDISQAVKSWTKVKILVPFYFMPNVVKAFGKAKAGSKEMIDEYGVKVITSRYGDFYPRTRDRVVLLEGPNESVIKAVSMICNSIRSADIPPNISERDLKALKNGKQDTLRFLISSDTVEENFSTVEAQEAFNYKHDVKLHIKKRVILDEDDAPRTQESIVSLNGSEEEIMNAVKELISKTDYRKVVTNLDFYGKYREKQSGNGSNEPAKENAAE